MREDSGGWAAFKVKITDPKNEKGEKKTSRDNQLTEPGRTTSRLKAAKLHGGKGNRTQGANREREGEGEVKKKERDGSGKTDITIELECET